MFGPDRRWLYQVDLGTDEILAFAWGDGLAQPVVAFAAPPSTGPRHLVFHPSLDIAFLISELASTLTVLKRDGSGFFATQVISTLPPGFDGESLGGHLGINAAGSRIYATNRGHDSIAVFAFDGERLSLIEHVRSGGASPRFFLLLESEKLLLLANEESGNVTGFTLRDDGTLARTELDLAVPGAVHLFADCRSRLRSANGTMLKAAIACLQLLPSRGEPIGFDIVERYETWLPTVAYRRFGSDGGRLDESESPADRWSGRQGRSRQGRR